MEFLQLWLPLILGISAIVIALVHASRTSPGMVDLTGVLDEAEGYLAQGAEIISEGAAYVQEMTPAAITIVKGLRQLYLTGELELEELKPKAVAQLQALFPNADPEKLSILVEGAVFSTKLVARELWQRTVEPALDGKDDDPSAEGEEEAIPHDGTPDV